MTRKQRTRKTYVYEMWRAGAAGVIETAGITFLLLIAVRWLEAGPIAKALVAASPSVGLLLSPLVVTRVSLLGWPCSQAAARLMMLGAAGFTVAAAYPVLPVYIAGAGIGVAVSSAILPLMTQMYQENYPERERGQRFSRTIMIRIGTVAVFSKVAGDALMLHDKAYVALLLVFAAAAAFSSFCLGRCPTSPITSDGGSHPLRALRLVAQDKLFLRVLFCWMLLGFANLMMLPLRVEYLANPRYGHAMSASQIALLTLVLPNLARLGMSMIWGWLFDRMNFFVLRIVLNLGFALGISLFFLSNSLTGMAAGALVFGVSNAGGDVAWSLWVTKFAPPTRVADYMSVHTFLTGVRGVTAPAVGFLLIQLIPISALALISTGMILVASLLLVPGIPYGAKARPASVLVEEISE